MSSTSSDQLIVAPRFAGPPRSGNGGYVAGLLAHALQPDRSQAVEVSLLAPPPLDVALDVRRGNDGLELALGETTIARAQLVPADLQPVDPVDLATATRATADFPGLSFHPFPTCFACGTEREDGLRIFPGLVPAVPGADDLEQSTAAAVAATWTPHEDVAADFHGYDDSATRASGAATWAALDCIGGWAGDQGERLMVLGRMTAALDSLPVVGEPHVVVGRALGAQGRKTFTASTLYDPDGQIVGRARHIWIAVDPATINPPGDDRPEPQG